MSREHYLAPLVIGALSLTLGGCELGPKAYAQNGYRGTGMDQITAKSRMAAYAVPAPPYDLPADDGPRAKEVYQNVQVLGNVSAERFNHLMAAINTWVAPQQGSNPDNVGCNYCHNPQNLASDEKYTKVVARRMLQMTMNINSTWKTHVKGTGVTCYTCHRGNAVPKYVWSMADAPGGRTSITGNKFGQNTPVPAVAYSSLPYDPFTTYLSGTKPIRVQGKTALPPSTSNASIAHTEQTYGLMMHMSSSLNVNCTYCHNSRAFAVWSQSPAPRAQAWYGIRMVRDVNNEYITSLANVFPAYRKGPHGDVLKANCQTCHQGQNKPLGGVSMLKDYPDLAGMIATPATVGTTAPPQASASAAPEEKAPAAGTKP